MIKTVGNFLFQYIAPIAVLASAGMVVFAMGKQEKLKRKKKPPRASIPVEVVNAKSHDGLLKIDATGVVIPYREVKISAQVSGQVISKSDVLQPGSYINKGDELVRIDPRDYELEILRLEHELAKADSDLINIEIDKTNAERLVTIDKEIVDVRSRDFERMQSLRAAQAGSASEQDSMKLLLLDAKHQLTNQENRLRELSAEKMSLELTKKLVSVNLDKAKLNMERTVIRAPFSGVVIETHVEENSILQSGVPIATIEDTSMVEVRCNLETEDIGFVHQEFVGNANEPGQLNQEDAYRLAPVPVTIQYERGDRTYTWEGYLSRHDGLGMDEKTRTIPVRIRVSNPTKSQLASSSEQAPPLALVRGMFVHVIFNCTPKNPLLKIPESVIRPGKTVWQFLDNQLHIKPIRVVRFKDGNALIDSKDSHLTLSDSIISTPVPNAKDGLKVSLLEKRKVGGKSKGKPKARKKSRGTSRSESKVTFNSKVTGS